MKKVAFLVVFFTIAINGLAQNSRQDLMDYLAKNVNSLDPIEGLYDVEWNCRYITPFVDQSYGIFSASMIIVKRNDGTFYIAYGSGYGFDSYEYKILNNITISRLGATNVYNFTYYTSKCRIYLTDNNTHFIAKMELDNGSARKLIPWMNIAPSVHIYPVYDCIKTYPTPSMYRR